MTAKPARQLTLKQLSFIQHYIDTKNATQAVVLAGYSKRSASKHAGVLLASPLVKEALEKYRAEINARTLVSFQEKAQLLWEIAQRCARPNIEQVGDKSIIVDRTPTAIKAIEVLNAMQGHVAPQQSVSINVQSTIEKLKQCVIEYKDH